MGGRRLESPPRWVVVTALALGAVLLILLGMMLWDGEEHSPARHAAPSQVLGPDGAGAHPGPVG